MPKRITRYVNVRHPETLEFHHLKPGDLFPEWAAELVTNPDVFEDDTPAVPEPVVDDVQALRERAKELGIDARGGADKLRARIAEKEAEPVEPPTTEDLRATATSLGIEFDDETTDTELELLIESNRE